MKEAPETMMIDEVKYVREDSVQNSAPAAKVDGLECVIVRTYSAGVFMGFMESREGKEVVLLNARRLWYWDGAASLSQLAMEGTKNPNKCKFPQPVRRVTLTEAVEILEVTAMAKASIDGVPEWKR